MLPAHIAEDIRKQTLYYLQSTFDFRRRAEDDAFTRFFEDPEKGIFKGLWVSVRRPFRPAPDNFKSPSHFHPLLKTAHVPITGAMRKLLSRGTSTSCPRSQAGTKCLNTI